MNNSSTHETNSPPNTLLILFPKEQANILCVIAAISCLRPDPDDQFVERKLRRLNMNEDFFAALAHSSHAL